MLQKEGYPLDWLQELKEKNNIIDVISRYVPLQQKGGNFWGCCPFHHEKTPSFSVKDDGEFFHCFGCGESGDVITFIQKIEGLTFPEAVQFLAERAGMEVPKSVALNGASADNKRKRDRLYEILTLTAKFYHENLMGDKGAAAREYLEKRGVGQNLMVRFGLGYSPDYNGVINHLKGKGYSEAEIIESGVGWVSERSQSKRPFDNLQQRLIVPIFDLRGRVVAFSGRALTKDYSGGKYVNYKNTMVFEKGKVLYAANFVKTLKTKTAIDKVIIVEGYMDVISLANAGISNVVAGMGTAFTPDQAKIAARLSDNVCVCYDGDTAGQAATIKNLAVLNGVGANLRVVTIPVEGMDPDDYIKKFGKAGFEKLLKTALPYVEFMLEYIAGKHDMKTKTGCANYLEEALDFLKGIQNEAGREVYLEILRDKSGISVDTLKKGLVSDISAVITPTAALPQIQRVITDAETEAARYVLNTMATYPAFARPSDIVSKDVFGQNETHRLVYDYLTDTVENGKIPAIHMLYSLSSDEEIAHIVNSVKEFSDETTLVKFYKDSVRHLNLNFITFKLKELSQKIDGADVADKPRLMEEYREYQRRQKNLL